MIEEVIAAADPAGEVKCQMRSHRMKRELFRAIEEPVLPQPGDHQHVSLADAISSVTGRWVVNPSEPCPVAWGLSSVRGRRWAAT
jgi:hypothetical protein